jgi:hypothetical protein
MEDGQKVYDSVIKYTESLLLQEISLESSIVFKTRLAAILDWEISNMACIF